MPHQELTQCWACGIPDLSCEYHHIAPRSSNGSNHARNKVPLCWSCHTFLDRKRLRSDLDISWMLSGLLSGDKRQSRLLGLFCVEILAYLSIDKIDCPLDKSVLKRIGRACLDDAFDWKDFWRDPDDMKNLLISFSALNRQHRINRTKGALAAKRQLGEKLGGSLPYGYQKYRMTKDNGRSVWALRPDPEEMQTVRRILDLKDQGRSYREIIDILDEEGVVSRTGGRFRFETLRSIVRNAA